MNVQALLLAQVVGSSGPQTASDNFNSYANGALLSGSGNWLRLYGAAADLSIIKPAADGRFTGANGDTQNILYYTSGTWADDQWSEVTGTSNGGFAPPMVAVRCASNRCYSGFITPDFGGRRRLFTNNNGTVTQLVSQVHTYTPGATIRLLVTGTGAATRLTLSENGTPIISSFDPGTYYASGNPGIGCGGNQAGTGDGGTNWNGSDN